MSLEACLFVLIHISDVTGSNAFFSRLFQDKSQHYQNTRESHSSAGFGLSKKVLIV